MKLTYRTTGNHGVEWQAVGNDGEPLGPWRETQHEARKDGENVTKLPTQKQIP